MPSERRPDLRRLDVSLGEMRYFAMMPGGDDGFGDGVSWE